MRGGQMRMIKLRQQNKSLKAQMTRANKNEKNIISKNESQSYINDLEKHLTKQIENTRYKALAQPKLVNIFSRLKTKNDKKRVFNSLSLHDFERLHAVQGMLTRGDQSLYNIYGEHLPHMFNTYYNPDAKPKNVPYHFSNKQIIQLTKFLKSRNMTVEHQWPEENRKDIK